MVTIKQLIKKMLQAVVATVAPVIWRLDTKPRLLIMMYHRVLPANHPDRATEQAGMYVSPQTLAMHLQLLKRHFTLMHLEEWVSAVEQKRDVPRRVCAITFDDGWLDNFEYAWPVLKAHSVPATIYLVSELVGHSYLFWPNRLQHILAANPDGSALPTHWPRLAADDLIEHCKRTYTDAEVSAVLDDVDRRLHLDTRAASRRNLMNWDEINSMAKADWIRFGSHSQHHARLLEKLPRTLLHAEIAESADTIEQNVGVRPTTFCYPNGDWCASSVDVVRAHYSAAVTTARGWNTLASNRWLLRRVGVHEDVANTRSSFLSRLAGVG